MNRNKFFNEFFLLEILPLFEPLFLDDDIEYKN